MTGAPASRSRPRRTTISEIVQRSNSIIFRLSFVLAALVLMLAVGGGIGGYSLWTMSHVITDRLAEVQDDSRLAARLTTTISLELQAATQYVSTRDPQLQADFERLGLEAHDVQREMNGQATQTADELRITAAIEERLSQVEIVFARSHRLADLGRMDEALQREGSVRPVVRLLMADIDRLGQLKAQRVATAAAELRSRARFRTGVLAIAVVIALVVAVLVGVSIIRAIYRPLRALVAHARELSQGNLSVRTHDRMPGEFEMLAGAMNQTSESLSRLANVATQTSDDVTQSAHDLASIAEQISLSSSQMAGAMGDITTGAEAQVGQLRRVDEGVRAVGYRATEVLGAAREVDTLAHDIEQSAHVRQQEIGRAMAILGDVRSTVQHAAVEVTSLNTTTEDIARFVGTVSRIAEQTNLLALNAAIEAARAGRAGRGFAVVADEVRKLAEQAQAAADEIVQLTSTVTARVTATTTAMQAGVQRVGEIEGLSRDVSTALTHIVDAAGRTRLAANEVSVLAEMNETLVKDMASGLGEVARTAEAHAASAQQVSASTEEQSAACEQMSSASTQLLAGSAQLRTIVGGLRTQAPGTTPLPGPVHTPLPANYEGARRTEPVG